MHVIPTSLQNRKVIFNSITCFTDIKDYNQNCAIDANNREHLPAFCQPSWEGHLLEPSCSDFHLIVFCFAPRFVRFPHVFCHSPWEFSADSFDHAPLSDSFPPLPPASLCLSLMHLSPLVSINTPFSPLQKPDSHWFSDLYTHLHHPLPSSSSLSSFYRWSFTVCTSWFSLPPSVSLFKLHLDCLTFSPSLAGEHKGLIIVYCGHLSPCKGFKRSVSVLQIGKLSLRCISRVCKQWSG